MTDIGTVTTFGSGTARATPDLMRVTISIESRDETVSAAYTRAGERSHAVIGTLRADGVRPADIATSGLSVRTDTVWGDNNRERVVGYIASTALTVVLRDIGPAGAATESATPAATVIAHAVDAGGDDVRLGGLTLTVSDEEALLTEARDAAWDNAFAKATQYATRAGRTLGAVLEVTEDISPSNPIPRAYAVAAKANGGGVPEMAIELGESELSATIRVTWRLA
ncbi:SIMPL domain-containing protein [Nocardia sp. NPDC050406]|uniref:SIMPL domain-containing protein n=1 Tax=Nocardia sp. NPDC050406 TaxID=3364318 RepID=UPI0037A12287